MMTSVIMSCSPCSSDSPSLSYSHPLVAEPLHAVRPQCETEVSGDVMPDNNLMGDHSLECSNEGERSRDGNEHFQDGIPHGDDTARPSTSVLLDRCNVTSSHEKGLQRSCCCCSQVSLDKENNVLQTSMAKLYCQRVKCSAQRTSMQADVAQSDITSSLHHQNRGISKSSPDGLLTNSASIDRSSANKHCDNSCSRSRIRTSKSAAAMPTKIMLVSITSSGDKDTCAKSITLDRLTNCNSSDTDVITPPDGDWGWMVVFASFIAHVIADGCGFSFGVLFSELLDVFGETKGRTAWVGSLFVSVPAICGPIASAVTNRYGCRLTTVLGGLIAGIGCFLSAYATSIGQLCVTFGLIAGFGLSLVFVPSVVIVAFYFEKRRAFATGIAVAGSGIGTVIFAPLTEFLIDRYQWRGALSITSGILLNIVVCGALFRPLRAPRRSRNKSPSPQPTLSNLNNIAEHSPGDSLSSEHLCRSPTDITQQLFSSHSLTVPPSGCHRLRRLSNESQNRCSLASPNDVMPASRSTLFIDQATICRPAVETDGSVDYAEDRDQFDNAAENNNRLSMQCANTDKFGSECCVDQPKPIVSTRSWPQFKYHSMLSVNGSLLLTNNNNNSECDENTLEAYKSSHLSKSNDFKSMQEQTEHSICEESIAKYNTDEKNERKLSITPTQNVELTFTDAEEHVRLNVSAEAFDYCNTKAVHHYGSPKRHFLSCHQDPDQFHGFLDNRRHSGCPVYLHRGDIAHRGSLLKAGFFLNSGNAHRSISCPIISTASSEPHSPWHRNILDIYKLRLVTRRLAKVVVHTLDLSIFRSAIFVYFCIHTVLLYISYDIPYVYGPVRATSEEGITDNSASMLVSIIGLFSTIGQILMGYLGDQSYISVLTFYNIMTSIAGITTLLMPLAGTFISLAGLCAAYGFFISANFALTTVILVELLGMERLTNAYGVVSLAQGIANLVGPPLAGWISDETASFDAAFYSSGCIICLSGLMLFAAPCLARCEEVKLHLKNVATFPLVSLNAKTPPATPDVPSEISANC